MPKSDGSHIHQQFSLLGYPSNPSSTGILQDLYPADLRTVQVAYKPPRSTPKSYKPERLVSRQLRRGRKELDEDKSSYEGSSLSRDSVQPQHKPQKPTLKSYKTYDSEKSSLSRDSVQAHKQPQPTLKSYKGYKPRTFVSRQSPGGSRELNEDKGSYDGSSISRESVWAQPLTYDNLRTYDTHKHYSLKKPEKVGWSRRRKVIVCGSIATFVIVVVIIVGVAVVLSRKGTYKYTESYAHVTSSEAFKTGGATHTSPQDVDDGIGAGADKYVYYSGDASDFPIHTSWVSFGNMLQANLHTLQTSCSVLGYGKDNSKVVIEDIYEAIQNRANASLVDHRFIFAVILQEVRLPLCPFMDQRPTPVSPTDASESAKRLLAAESLTQVSCKPTTDIPTLPPTAAPPFSPWCRMALRAQPPATASSKI